MKFVCFAENLRRAVGITERFTGKNIALPILGHVLIDADGDKAAFTGTNLEHAVVWKMPARVAKKGKVCVPARTVSSLIQSLGEGEEISVEGDRGAIRLSTKTHEGKVNGMNPDEFPLIPSVKKSISFAMDASLLAEGLGRVLPAVSSSEFKPELTGVFVSAGRDGVVLAATDTFRLAEYRVADAKPRGGAAGDAVSFIVPERTAQELARVLEGSGGTVTVWLGENQMLVECGDGSVVSRLIEGKFPDYQAIIPPRFSTSVHVRKSDLADAIRAASIFASKLQEVTLHLSPRGVDVRAANPEVGEYRAPVPAAVEGKEIAMSFNWRYLLDGVQSLGDEDLFFGCNQESSPALLRNKSQRTGTYVVMPIRLS